VRNVLRLEVKNELFRQHEPEVAARDPLYLLRILANGLYSTPEELVLSTQLFVLLLDLFEPILEGALPRETSLTEDQGGYRKQRRSDEQARQKHHQQSFDTVHVLNSIYT